MLRINLNTMKMNCRSWRRPPAAGGPDSLAHWQERILFGVLASGLALSPVALIPAAMFIVHKGLWPMAAINAAAVGAWICLLFSRRLRYPQRSWGAIIVLYAVSLGVLCNIGIVSSGPFWLFSISIVAALLLGFKASGVTVVANAAILTGLGYLSAHAVLVPELPVFMHRQWALTALGNFILLNACSTLAVSIMVNGLERVIHRQQKSAQRLRREIDERRRAEAALPESEDKYRRIYENIQDVYYEASLDGRILEISPSIEQISQYRRSELIGQSLYALYADPEEREALVRAIVERRRVMDYEITMKDKDGSRHDCALVSSLIVDEAGRPAKIVGSLRDITERKRTQEALRRSEAQYRFLIEHSNDIIWVFDLDAMAFDYCSKSVERILGYPVEETRGMTLDVILRPAARRGIIRAFAGLLAGTNDSDRLLIEAEHRTREGKWIWMEINATLLKNGPGQAVTIIGVTRDIRARKQAEADQARIEAQKRQLQKAESLGRMAGAVAHLFNNHLTVVIGNLEMAIDEAPDGTMLGETVREALGAAHRSAEVSRLMLTYLGQDVCASGRVDLSESCRRGRAILAATLPRQVRLELDLADPGPMVLANDNQMQQVLINLVSNAREAIGERAGTVTLTTLTLPATAVRAAHLVPAGWQPAAERYACLEVSDTGRGINAEDLDKLFDPFFTTKMTGRGLGLAVVFGIVKTWGGMIGAESVEGRGTTFRIVLPPAAALQP